MTARHSLRVLLLVAVGLFGPGCASLEPNRLTVAYARGESETSGQRRQRAATDTVTVSASYDLR